MTADIRTATCPLVVSSLSSSSASLKDLYNALRVQSLLKCEIREEAFEGIIPRLQSAVSDAGSLFDLYHSIGSLVVIKEQSSKVTLLEDADGVFRSIKALSQSDGRWRYSSNNPESSTFAAGVALETLAGVVSLASSEIDKSLVDSLKENIVKLFDSIEKYDDGALFFEEKLVSANEHRDTLSTTASVVRGIMSFSDVTSGSLNLPKDKILGLARFFLGIGIPGNAHDFYYQMDSLARLENNGVSIPLILSLPTTVLSLTKKDQLKVKVSTVLGSSAPPLTVKLLKALSSSSKGSSIIENQELKFNSESGVYFLERLPQSVDVGNYLFVFEVVLHDSEHKKLYATGAPTKIPIFVTGVIKIDDGEISVLDGDLGSVDTRKKLELGGQTGVSLSANHLQKLKLSFKLTTPLGNTFSPHQAFLKLRHESKVEHIFVVGSSGKTFEIILDFLGLVEKLFYLSGAYDIELAVGDSVMENSFLQTLGRLELDLPEAPEKAPRPPVVPFEPYSRFGPKEEINHIFRAPEKRPPKELSLTFLGLSFLPLIGFFVGLLRLGVNLKNFPTSAVPATFAMLFQLGIGAVLLLYSLFWLKLDLFTTLKMLGILGAFLILVGHRTLSYLSSTSAKLKSA